MKKYLLLVALLVASVFVSPATAAETTACDFPSGLVILSGQVTKNGSTPVYGAHITLTQISSGMVCEIALTNPFGYYSFSPVFTAGYGVTVAKKGCEGFATAITLFSDRTLNVELNCDE
jgi:hypothetical protein